jgi:hypothetical protein
MYGTRPGYRVQLCTGTGSNLLYDCTYNMVVLGFYKNYVPYMNRYSE